MKTFRNSGTFFVVVAAMMAALLLALLLPLRTNAQSTFTIDWESANGVPLLRGEQVTTQYANATPVSFTVSAVNNNGPNVALIFDSSNPGPPGQSQTGDVDLGTPNETCGGPGEGADGEVGQPGVNCVAEGNLLIIAENVADGNNDGYVDSPDDDANGGTITIIFGAPVNVLSTVILDQESPEAVDINAYDAANTLLTTASPVGLGDNSREEIPVGAIGATRLEFVFTGSGGIATIVVEPPETLAISLGVFNTAVDTPLGGLWILASAMLLSSATVIAQRRMRRQPIR